LAQALAQASKRSPWLGRMGVAAPPPSFSHRGPAFGPAPTQKTQRLSRDGALALLMDLRSGYSKPAFQNKLAKLMLQEGRVSKGEHVNGRHELALIVQQVVLPRYGFEPNTEDFMEAVDEIVMFSSDPEISKCIQAINKCLKIPERTDSKEDNEHESGGCQEADKPSCMGSLSRTGAHAMLNELLAGYGRPHFQQQLAKLVRSEKARVGKGYMFVRGRNELSQTVCFKVLPRYGFAASEAGMKVASKEIEQFRSSCPEITAAWLAVRNCLKQPPEIEISGLEQVRCWTSPHKPRLSRGQAHSLMLELHHGYNSASFQKKLNSLMNQLGPVSEYRVDVAGRTALMFSVQRKVLPSYGFEANNNGVRAMDEELDCFLACQEIFEVAMAINKCLKMSSTYSQAEVLYQWEKKSLPTKPLELSHDTDPADSSSIGGAAEHMEETIKGSEAVNTQIKLAPKHGSDEPIGSLDSPCNPKLSLDRAHALVLELHQAYSRPWFQAELAKLTAQIDDLTFSVLRDILPHYNFEVNTNGVSDVVRELDLLAACPDLRESVSAVKRCLDTPTNKESGEKPSSFGVHATLISLHSGYVKPDFCDASAN